MDLITNISPNYSLLSCLEHDTRMERSLARVDIICSYIKMSGLMALNQVFDNLLKKTVPVRVLTTTAMGISEPEAIRDLNRLSNVEVQVL